MMTTTTHPPCPFTAGQRVIANVTNERGVVLGASYDEFAGCWIVGVRCDYGDGWSLVHYTADAWKLDEPAPAADDYQPLPWMCATCVETRLEERDPARPTHCKSCPERYAVRWETNRQIVITAYLDGQVHGRRFYRRDADGAAAAERCVARFAQDGYPLRES